MQLRSQGAGGCREESAFGFLGGGPDEAVTRYAAYSSGYSFSHTRTNARTLARNAQTKLGVDDVWMEHGGEVRRERERKKEKRSRRNEVEVGEGEVR